MSRGDLPWRFIGRPIKPLAFAQMVALFVIGWAYLWHTTDEIGTDNLLGDATGLLAFMAGLLLLAGWWRGSQRLAEIGLLIGAGVWIARAALVLMLGYNEDPVAFWLSLCWATAAGGAFLLESIDEEVDGIWTRPSRKP